MRRISKFFLVVMIILFLHQKGMSQHFAELSIGYGIGIPEGPFRNYVTNPSFTGFSAGFAIPVTDQFRLGLNVGYNDYYQKYARKVFTGSDGSAISAVISNSVQEVPLTINANYTLLKKGPVLPYIGVGGGLNFISFDQYLGEFDGPVTKTKWTANAEAGIWIPLSTYSTTAIKLGASYNYSPFNNSGIDKLSYLGINAGIRFAVH